MDAFSEEQTRSCMSKIVKPRLRGKFSFLQKPLEIAVQGNRFQWSAGRAREGEVAIFPFRPSEQAILGLLCAASLEGAHYAFRNCNNPSAPLSLNLGHLK